MKSLYILAISLFITLSAAAQKVPKVSKTEFPEAALQQVLYGLDGSEITAGSILETYRGKTVLLYIWATWCPDCLKGFPELKAFQKANPDVSTLYFSLDRKEEQWKNGIEKFALQGQHYWFKTEWKNEFTNAIELNWIPRYLIIDPDGRIAKYYAVKADDPTLQETVDSLTK